MPHFYPVVIQSGKSLAGDSLGFHAYSLRIDNLTNQWLLEETSLAWIPPYSLGSCLRLYGTGVAILLNQAPAGQPQPAPVAGEQSVGVYSDQLRTEVAGTAVRQFTLIQAVSDLTEGPQPAYPPVGVDRLYADTQGRIHHLHSDGTDLILVDPSQGGVITSAMILDGTIQAADLAAGVAAANVGALGGVLTGTLPNPGMQAGAAAANVGTLGGSLTGILPSPGLAANSVGSSQIVDGSIGNIDMQTGAAAANVGTLGGALTGTLPNPGLAAGAAQAQIGSYSGSPTWSSNASGYQETAVQATVACTGVLVRLEATVSFYHSAAAAALQFAFMVDGTLWSGSLAVINQPVGGYVCTATIIFYAVPTAGTHRFAVAVNNLSVGTFNLYTGAVQTLWVTEQRR
jgi:hypothetical protein